MKIIKTIGNVRSEVKSAKIEGKSVGFVPTMGFLHKGHLSLINEARKENDIVVVSIFVNPTQFGPGEDYDTYPRNIDEDAAMCEEAGVDIIFAPEAGEMYDKDFCTNVEVEGGITKKLCGKSRPVFFKGITTVVSKLFNIIPADRAYFGQKDAQQVAVIKQMVKDLNIDIEIIPCPIVREKDGIAMSSRNSYLNSEERRAALILSKSLMSAREMINKGERDSLLIKDFILKNIKSEPLVNIDYVEISDADTLEPIEKLNGNILIALAVMIGKARLIDNIIMEVK